MEKGDETFRKRPIFPISWLKHDIVSN